MTSQTNSTEQNTDKSNPPPESIPRDFKGLINEEYADLFPNPDETNQTPRISVLGPASEPWVAFTTKDCVGLALSGGGIRSATFNLGLLQSLQHHGILRHVHYLSTVSGGGYIGGFWTRWRQRIQQSHNNNNQIERQNKQFQPEAPEPGKDGSNIQGNTDKVFPEATGYADMESPPGPNEIREPAEIRHLREYSRFLIPRKGLTTEFWSALITVLSGLVPSLMAAMAAVLLTMALWAIAAAWVIQAKNGTAQTLIEASATWWHKWWFHPFWWEIASVFTVLATGALIVLEWRAQRSGRSGIERSVQRSFSWRYALWTVVAFLGSWFGWLIWSIAISPPAYGVSLGLGVHHAQLYNFNTYLLGPSFALMIALAVLTVVRVTLSRIFALIPDGTSQSIAHFASLERVMGRLLAIQVLWAVLVGIWELARWLTEEAGTTESIGGTGGVTAVLAYLFYQIQRRLAEPNKGEAESKVFKWLKPWAPQLLAKGIVLLLFVLAAVVILQYGLLNGNIGWHWWILSGSSLGMLVIMLILFDPMRVGLHEFYRSRLTRCYLGASQTADQTTDPQPDRLVVECRTDDMLLNADNGRPLHLICCAANQLWGDPLSTLHRGARSAVLSRHGIAIGNASIEDKDKDLKLSSAMTASAAAFNSLMGEKNMVMGRAVAFVMTALNLRLGLWVRNPARSEEPKKIWRLLPGLYSVKEMLALASANSSTATHVHLSDGGHFENLAFYELVRRHCRYIIVSDAGEDHAFEFTDFGRAVRRVREDFGVEVEIDLTSLKPGPDRLSQQHLAVGTIHYNGVTGTDKGTIVYFKPTLTGDEPVDVQQYRQGKPRFPHESTGDQFYDEAQWESYRRLGEHTGHASMRTFESQVSGDDPARETFFRDIRLYWQRVPWMDCADGVRLCEHAVALEDALRDQPSLSFYKEYFGEPYAAALHPIITVLQTSQMLSTDQVTGDFLWALRVLKFSEEAFVICKLDSYWSHPRAYNWMSYLHRWAAMPTLHRWWPLLKPMFGAPFQAFAEKQLNLPLLKHDRDIHFHLVPRPNNLESGYAWQRLQKRQPEFKHAGLWDYSLELTLPNSSSIQVGLAFIEFNIEVASWHIDDLFVPPELHGGGFSSKLLEELIRDLSKPERNISHLRVTLENRTNPNSNRSPRPRRDQAGRQEQIEVIGFYRSRGFKFVDKPDYWNSGQNICMVLNLKKPHTD